MTTDSPQNTSTLALLSPAKLNLFLHILGRRGDGYHELQTLFQLLDYGDTLTFTLAPPGQVEFCVSNKSNPEIDLSQIPLEENLILRALQILKDNAKSSTYGVKISLEKKIPIGGGLGGGSSNAATTLIALNNLWQTGFSRDELAKMGLALGADVPVFIHGYTAWAEGVGEILTQTKLPQRYFVVATPDCQVPTHRIFSHEQLTRNTQAIKMSDFLDGDSKNDCEFVACSLYPQIEDVLRCLRQYGPARMTGTGSSVFATFESLVGAEKVLEALPANVSGFVAGGLNFVNVDVK
ncbi:MAG: 4-(cytidine 5'-diphospho)-2-C-methyl-D-erythritol kinase [Gammaproteobacteria bacterium]|nr:4-(cytidine 5'-diphospho)-2-C-methyl-D-erythritol kinase [Gammaproteobacteria bacterium]